MKNVYAVDTEDYHQIRREFFQA